MKQLFTLAAFALLSLTATAKNVAIALSDYPPGLTNQLAATYALHQMACRTNGQGVVNCPQYALQTNIVTRSTNDLGEVTAGSTNVVFRNQRVTYAEWLRELAADPRTKALLREAIADFTRRKTRELGDARNEQAGGE